MVPQSNWTQVQDVMSTWRASVVGVGKSFLVMLASMFEVPKLSHKVCLEHFLQWFGYLHQFLSCGKMGYSCVVGVIDIVHWKLETKSLFAKILLVVRKALEKCVLRYIYIYIYIYHFCEINFLFINLLNVWNVIDTEQFILWNLKSFMEYVFLSHGYILWDIFEAI
jgi:hypothetical protein